MKKQYLIGLLGLTAVSVPLGNSLLNSANFSINTKPTSSSTGIAINDDKSSVSVFDINGNEKAGKGDTLASIKISATYIAADRDNLEAIDLDNDLLHFYYASEAGNSVDLSYTQLNENGEYTKNEDGGEFKLSIDSEEDADLTVNDKNIWDYELQNNNAFAVTTDATKIGKEDVFEEEIGEIKINDKVVDNSISAIVETLSEPKQVSPTSESVKYNVTPGKDASGKEDVPVTSVKWVTSSWNEKDKNDDNVLAINDTDLSGEGTLIAKDLNSFEDYNNTKIVALSGDDYSDPAEVNDFKTMSAQTDSEIIADEETLEVNKESASIEYSVTPGNDDFGDEVTISNVKWVTSEGDVLAEGEDGATSGTLEAKELTPGTEYSNTKIVATSSDVNHQPEDVVIRPFTTNSGQEDSEIIVDDEVNVISPTEANIDFSINEGQDEHGDDVTISDVKWVTKDDVELAKAKDGETTLTAKNLDPYTDYKNTKIVATSSDGHDPKPEKVPNFKTDSLKEDAIITANEVTVNPTDVTVSYSISGQDDWGNFVEVKEVKWISKTNGQVIGSEVNPELVDGVGTLTTNVELEPNMLYNTKLIATTTDTNTKLDSTTSTDVEPFTTKMQENSIITPYEVESNGTSATVSYSVSGQDNQGNPIKVKEVKWISKTNGQVIGSEVNPEFINGVGTLTTNVELQPNTDYNNTSLVATTDASVNNTIWADVEPFTTGEKEESVEPIEPKDPDIKVSEEVLMSEDYSEAKIGYSIEHGLHSDESGTSTEIERIEWFAADGEILADEHENSVTNGRVTLGSITATDLKLDTDYEDTYIIVTMNDDSTDREEVSTFSTKAGAPIVPDNTDGLGGWAIFGIIVATLSIVGIIGYGGYYLYKKYMPSKA